MQRKAHLAHESTGNSGVGHVQSDPVTRPKKQQLDTLKYSESEQQRPIIPNIKGAVLVSGRRPSIAAQAHVQRHDGYHYQQSTAAKFQQPSSSKAPKTYEKEIAKVRTDHRPEANISLASRDPSLRQIYATSKRNLVEETRRPSLQDTESRRRAHVQFPLTADEVKQLYRKDLTDFELQEIQKYKEIWYLGLIGKNRQPTRPKKNRDENEDGMYAAEAHEQVAYRYEIVSLLGRGSFGQVFKCRDHKTSSDVAVKILRNKKKFYRQGIVEVRLLDHIRKKDHHNTKNVIHMLDCFHFRKHICIVMELCGINLYDLLKRNAFNGFSLMAVKRFAWNLLQALALLQQENIIHCDVKPENILLKARQNLPGHSIYDVKLTDFGSGCYIQEQIFCYIQSRYYRAPEIILGFSYDCAIDVWSFACVLAELLLGKPIFPGENEADQLACIMEVLGLPPRRMIATAPRAKYFFDSSGEPTKLTNQRGKKRVPGTKSLQSLLKTSDRRFLEFMRRCLEWDPRLRVNAQQLLTHEWMIGSSSVRSIKDLASVTSYPSRRLDNSHTSEDYDHGRDLIAELLETNPFHDEESGVAN